MPSKKWTYETCWQAAIEFTTLKDFRNKYPSACNVASRNGWIKEYTWMKVCNNHGYWDYDKCYEEAKKYATITDFAKGCGSAHFRARENGWIKDYTWFVDGKQLSVQKRTKWDYDACYELAKQCVKKSEMKDKNIRAYQVALKNGWFTDYTWFLSEETIRHQKRPSRVKWPYEKCKEFALQYSTLAEFQKAYPSVYTVSKRNGWIDDFDWLLTKTDDSDERTIYVYEFSDGAAYVGLTKWIEHRDYQHRQNKNASSVYEYSIQNNIEIPEVKILEENINSNKAGSVENKWINFYRKNGWKMVNKVRGGSIGGGRLSRNYTKEQVIEETKQYKNQEEVYNKNRSLYNAMRRLRVVKECFPKTHFKPKTVQHYDYSEEFLKEITSKYKKKSDLRNNEYRVYHWLYEHNRLYDFYEKASEGNMNKKRKPIFKN